MLNNIKRYEQGDAALLVNHEWCKGCNICVEACPSDILTLDDADKIQVTDVSKCIFCGICAARCPDFCFTLERPESNLISNNSYETYTRK